MFSLCQFVVSVALASWGMQRRVRRGGAAGSSQPPDRCVRGLRLARSREGREGREGWEGWEGAQCKTIRRSALTRLAGTVPGVTHYLGIDTLKYFP